MNNILFFLIGLAFPLVILIIGYLDYQQWRVVYMIGMPVGLMVTVFLLAYFKDRRLPLSLGFLLGFAIVIWQALK